MRQRDTYKKKNIKRRDKKKNKPQLKKRDKIYLLTNNLHTNVKKLSTPRSWSQEESLRVWTYGVISG